LQEFNPSSEHNLVKESVIKAGKLALKWFKKDPEQWKKDDGTLVSKADIEINDLLNKLLKDKNPEFGWLSEENEDDKSRLNKEITFVVDPLDGTQAFLEGKREFSISVAIVENGLPISGIVFSPSTNEENLLSCSSFMSPVTSSFFSSSGSSSSFFSIPIRLLRKNLAFPFDLECQELPNRFERATPIFLILLGAWLKDSSPNFSTRHHQRNC